MCHAKKMPSFFTIHFKRLELQREIHVNYFDISRPCATKHCKPRMSRKNGNGEALFESHFLSADLPIIMEFQPKDDNH